MHFAVKPFLSALVLLQGASCYGRDEPVGICDLEMLGSKLGRSLEFTVPKSDAASFNLSIISYLEAHRYKYQTGEWPNYLPPPTKEGYPPTYKKTKTIGCTSQIIIWSENVKSEDKFLVSIHYTKISDKRLAEAVALDIENTFNQWISGIKE